MENNNDGNVNNDEGRTGTTRTNDGGVIGAGPPPPPQQQAFVSPFSPLFSKLDPPRRTTRRGAAEEGGRGAGAGAGGGDYNDSDDEGDDDDGAVDSSLSREQHPDPPTRSAKERWFQQLSLNGARKVSIVVRVDPTTTAATGNRVHEAADNDDGDVCLFPLVLSKDPLTHHHHQQRNARPPLVSAQEIVVVNPDAFGAQLQLPAAVTMERARLVSLLSRRGLPTSSGAGAGAPFTTPPAKGSSNADNPTEDWIRSYRFSSVVWSSAPSPTPATITSSPGSSAAPPPADADCWARLCKAMAGDVTMAGSIARRTVMSVGGATGGTAALNNDQSAAAAAASSSSTNRTSKVAAALSPSSVSNVHSVPAKTTLLFGTVATESVAHVLSHDHGEVAALVMALRHDPTPIVQRYGLLGLTCCYILQQIGALDHQPEDRAEATRLSSSSPSSSGSEADRNRPRPSRRKLRLTLSILEVADEDLLYDLLKLKPFARESAVQLKHSRSTLAAGASNDHDDPRAAAVSSSSAALVGLTDTPIDSLRTLGRCVRRAFTMAYHPRRTKPRGTLLAILKVWDSAASTTQRHTAVQFVDLAQVVPEDGGTFWRESQKPRNARLRQSLTALGAALRQVLLKEAGNSTVGSFRQHTLTQVLSRDLGGGTMDSRIVLLANLSPLSRNYSETMATIRFVSSIVTRPGDPLLSPFDKHHLLASGDATPNDNHTKTTSSPTSRASDDADDSFLTSASFTDEAVLQGALLRSVVADPRQRMAKLVRPAKPREQDSVNALVGSNEPYTPTNYMSTDPGDAAAAFARQAEEIAKRGEVAVSAVRGAAHTSSPRDAATNPRGPADSYIVLPEIGNTTSPLRGRHIETGLGSGTRDNRSDEEFATDGYPYGEPSPLTTDTGGHSAGFDNQQQVATSFPLEYLNQGSDNGDDLLSLGSMPDAHVGPKRLSNSNKERFDSERPKAPSTDHEDTIRQLQETILGLQSELQQSYDVADSEVAREREHGEDTRYQLESELEELRRLSQSKDDDLQHLQRRVSELRRDLEAQQKASADRVKRLHESFKADGNDLQERLEAEIEQLRLAIRSRDDSIADLQSLRDAQRQQLQRRLDEVLTDLTMEREKHQSDRSARSQASQDLVRVQREKNEQEAVLLRLQAELDEAKNELQGSVERIRHESDERARQLEELCLQYREEADQCRNKLSLRDDELQQLSGALARERVARESSDDEVILQLRLELEEARAEIERRDARIRELDDAVVAVESGRQEVLAIADEAIATQAELEKKIQDLDSALSAMGDRSVPKEQYEAAEKAYERVNHELHEARDDLLRAKTDANDATVRLAEVQFSLQSVEKERDHLAMRDAENQRELARLRSALKGSKSAGQEVERLSLENRRLLDELHQAQSLRSKYELELERELARREEEVERRQEEAALIKNELDLVVAEYSAASELNEQQIQDLRVALEDSELELSKLAAETNRSNDAAAKEVEESKQRMSAELDQLKQTCDRHLSDAEELSRRLLSTEKEKDDAVTKSVSLKRALAAFQDRTRTQVQTFVHHRSETKALLERTLEENDALAHQNRQLQAALEDLQSNPVGPLGRELDDALAQLSGSRSENADLRTTVQQLAGTIESLRGELERASRSVVPRSTSGGGSVDDGHAADLLRSLNDLVESRRLDDLLRPYRHNSVPSPRRPSSTHERQPQHPEADLVAHLALAAKASVDHTSAELSQLKARSSVDRRPPGTVANFVSAPSAGASLTRADKVSDLNRRVRVLESHRAVLDGLLSIQGQQYQKQQQEQQQRSRRSGASLLPGGRFRGAAAENDDDDDDEADVDDEADALTDDAVVERLSRRVRSLERRLERGW